MVSFFPLLLAVIMTSCAASTPNTVTPLPAHHTESGFRNLYIENGAKSVGDLLKWRFTSDKVEWTPSRVAEIPRVAVDQTKLAHPPASGQLTWLGHATVLFQAGDKTIITDPDNIDLLPVQTSPPFSGNGCELNCPGWFRFYEFPERPSMVHAQLNAG